MSQDNLVKLKCSETATGHTVYSRRNKKKTEKLELMKFNKVVRRHTLHKEVKK